MAEVLARREQRHLLASWRGATILLFYETPVDDRRGEATTRLTEELYERLPTIVVAWGIGRVRTGVDGLPQSYTEANNACQIGLRVAGVRSVTHIERTGTTRVLLHVADTEEGRALWQDYLGPLLAYDARRSGALLPTLIAYLEHQGNRSATARHLHVRRQSLDYRIHQIEQLTRRLLSDAREHFAFALSVELYRLHRRLNENNQA
jgi:DNA-binding PucR family transcriptional regulator